MKKRVNGYLRTAWCAGVAGLVVATLYGNVGAAALFGATVVACVVLAALDGDVL